jgi:hypothetical protein
MPWASIHWQENLPLAIMKRASPTLARIAQPCCNLNTWLPYHAVVRTGRSSQRKSCSTAGCCRVGLHPYLTDGALMPLLSSGTALGPQPDRMGLSAATASQGDTPTASSIPVDNRNGPQLWTDQSRRSELVRAQSVRLTAYYRRLHKGSRREWMQQLRLSGLSR